MNKGVSETNKKKITYESPIKILLKGQYIGR